MDRPLAVVADLCGPKIRVGLIAGGSVDLVAGEKIIIQRDPIEGTAERISTTLAELVDDVKVGQTLLLNDGNIRMQVVETWPPDEIVCKIICGGRLSNGKGVNLPDTDLQLSSLTEKDHQDIDWIAAQDFDYVALSFVRTADDVIELRRLLEERHCEAHIIAKIEKPQALKNIEAIIAEADVIMVARGDLGVEMDLPSVPPAQKRIARLCQKAGKPCIIATQMLESMTHAPIPTRAEVSDVANAVLDHADAVMLSGETSVGEYPVQTVDMMNRIVQAIQGHYDESCAPQPVLRDEPNTSAAMAGAVHTVLEMDHVSAVAVYTMTGATARLLAKNRLTVPILALSPDIRTVRRTCLYYGVLADLAMQPEHTREILDQAAEFAIKRGVAQSGDKIIVLSGRPIGQVGTTNTMVVHAIR
jgi:pyruvate kinase